MFGPPQEPQAAVTAPAPERLDSWKEIAGYLKRDVRTVQRWEKTEDLPVYRHMHGKLGSVYAYRTEVDAWWNNRRPKIEEQEKEAKAEAPRSRRRALALALALGSIAAGGVAVWRYRVAQRRKVPMLSQRAWSGRLGARAFSEGGHVTWISVGRYPLYAAISPSGEEVYVLNAPGASVSVISTRTNRVTQTIPVDELPAALTVSPDGRHLYVGQGRSDLTVINTISRTVSKMITGAPVEDVVITPDGRKLYLAMSWSGLKRVLLETGRVETIPTITCPFGLALTPDGKRLYVNYRCSGPSGSPGHDAIGMFDTQTDKALGSVHGFPNVGGRIVVSPDGAYVWAHGENACYDPKYDHIGCPVDPGSVINVLSTADNSLLQTLGFAGSLTRFSFSPDGSRVLVGAQNLEVLDTASFKSLETLPLPHAGTAVFTPDGRRVYVPVFDRDVVAVLDVLPTECEPPATGLTGFWPGDGNANDLRERWHGVLHNGATFAPGRVGQAFLFDGVNGFVQVNRPVMGSSVTMAAWVKFNSLKPPISATHSLRGFMSIVDGTFRGRLVKDDSHHFMFCFGGKSIGDCFSSSVRSHTVAAPGVWFHVAGVKSPEGISIYVNGVLEATARPNPTNMLDPVNLWIGTNPVDGAFLNGLVDEVVLYNRPLTPSEVETLYRAGNLEQCEAGKAVQR